MILTGRQILAGLLSLVCAVGVVLGCELIKRFSPKPEDFPLTFNQLSQDARAQFYFSQALQLSFDGKFKEAQEEIQKALELDPDSAYLHFKLAQFYALSSNFPSAIEEANLAIKLNPNWTEPYFFLIELYMVNRKPERAEPVARKLIEVSPSDPLAYRELSRIYEVRGETSSAIIVLKDFLDSHPEQIELRKEYARLLVRVARIEEAERAYQGLLLDAPGDWEAWGEYGALSASIGKYLEAERAYQEELSLNPNNVQDQLELVKVLLRLGKKGEARAQLELAKTISREDPNPWFFSAYLYQQEGELDKAREEYLSLLELEPKAEQVLYNLGLIEMAQKNWAEAERRFSQIPSNSSLYLDSQAQIIWANYSQGKKEEAINSARNLTKAHPGKSSFWLILAEIYQKEEQYELAKQILLEALTHIPEDPDLFYSLAIVYSLMGDNQKALELAQLALKKKPGDPGLLNFIGYTWVEEKVNLKEAEEYLKKALEMAPEDGAIIDSIGWLYFQKGSYPEALKWVKRALEKMPEDPEILKHLGQIWLKLGDRKKARENLEKALSCYPRSALKEEIENLLKEIYPKE